LFVSPRKSGNGWRKNENDLLIALQDDCLGTPIAQPLSARKTK
jgi:hypothetical protein